ncbi:hypothetical protein N8I71_04515 [Roseibacterium sp. SDUM158016]|uniref:hypothetical protein n=1 Tax=Roseicyclus sediminis TaxID=2980997 RepID=UPI0021D15469|nr:hypothetical protein [Roseibacterium sp. SDUM158016]MCU4652079.1 hypothetical protein [Roseibacterium sp. SDUM158016]
MTGVKVGGNTRDYDETLRRLEQDNDDLRGKLARHEFRQMQQELTSEDPFRLDVLGPQATAPGDVMLPDVDDVLLPRLPVPAGTIARDLLSPDLPVIAVHDDGLSGRPLAAALMGLLKTQYDKPFARLVFLCSGFEAVPFLGRYGFAVEQVGRADPATLLPRLRRRYGVVQIRSVGSGDLIARWQGG